MKLIITGATGFVATEVVRQSLLHPGITKVVAVARKPVDVPEGIDGSKLENVTVEGYDEYPPAVREAFAGADACIWTVAVNFNKTGDYADQEAVRKITQDYTMEGLKAMHEAKTKKPFRFLYVSGSLSQRDQSQAPLLWSEYRLMRVSHFEHTVILQGRVKLTTLRARERTKSCGLQKSTTATRDLRPSWRCRASSPLHNLFSRKP